MGLEAGTFVNDLVTSNPLGTDGKSQGDDHLRLIKTVLQGSFPLAVGAREFRNDDAGATDTLIWNLWRKSATPAAADLLAGYGIEADSSTAVKRQVLLLEGRLDDPTNGSEDASWLVKAMVAGTLTLGATINGGGINGVLGNTTPAAVSGTTGTFSGALSATAGTFTSIAVSGDVVSQGNLVSDIGGVGVFGNETVGGSLRLRPQGVASATNQVTINSSGDMDIAGQFTGTSALIGGTITATSNIDCDGSFRGRDGGGATVLENLHSGNSTLMACFGGGNILLRPNGSASTTNQAVYSSGGTLTVVDLVESSDIKFKKWVSPIKNALEKVNDLRGVYYTRKGTKKRRMGLISQEAELVAPEIVDENDIGEKSIAYGHVTALLIEAIKMLDAKVERMQT